MEFDKALQCRSQIHSFTHIHTAFLYTKAFSITLYSYTASTAIKGKLGLGVLPKDTSEHGLTNMDMDTNMDATFLPLIT